MNEHAYKGDADLRVRKIRTQLPHGAQRCKSNVSRKNDDIVPGAWVAFRMQTEKHSMSFGRVLDLWEVSVGCCLAVIRKYQLGANRDTVFEMPQLIRDNDSEPITIDVKVSPHCLLYQNKRCIVLDSDITQV